MIIKKKYRRLISFSRLFFKTILNSKFKIGIDYIISKNIFISRKNSIKIGNNFYMGKNCHLSANVNIGNNVLFSSYVSLVGGDHKIDKISTSMKDSGYDDFRTIYIGDNVWIGHGTIIMHGVKISSGVVVGAGSVVTKDIPKNEIWVGNPAVFLRKRIL